MGLVSRPASPAVDVQGPAARLGASASAPQLGVGQDGRTRSKVTGSRQVWVDSPEEGDGGRKSIRPPELDAGERPGQPPSRPDSRGASRPVSRSAGQAEALEVNNSFASRSLPVTCYRMAGEQAQGNMALAFNFQGAVQVLLMSRLHLVAVFTQHVRCLHPWARYGQHSWIFTAGITQPTFHPRGASVLQEDTPAFPWLFKHAGGLLGRDWGASKSPQ
ncbi:unnamed protein product [Polarella glacialis]|uniref:Uncharacterized protein n=1 Tax=Polarella glacialis TaxID=89957 RepID=A0A813KKE4_POLGL|nr:unnamed protein product [Polarella glacialis]